MSEKFHLASFPTSLKPSKTVSKSRIKQTLSFYGILYVIAFSLYFLPSENFIKPFAIGLLFPGAGFLSAPDFGVLYFSLTFLVFTFSLFLWFATGNIILPPLIWLSAAVISIFYSAEAPVSTNTLFLIPPILIFILWAVFKTKNHLGHIRRKKLNDFLSTHPNIIFSDRAEDKNDELSLLDLQHMKLFLDRSLQPINEFNGFDRLDQFQTAAIRYQINFMSYAMSVARNEYFPAFSGYIDQAQQNLHHKQENHKVWKYWELENSWGNLNLNPNPIIKDNIMFSGFFSAQIAYNILSRSQILQKPVTINCLHPSGKQYSYSLTETIEILVQQFKHADFGLLPCEPNWIYPLCNAITATAVRAHDTLYKTSYWEEIKHQFRHALETEFIAPNGHFVPFRSAYTGFSAPQIGGAVMQAFPCYFLNALFPDLALRQWMTLKHDLKTNNWKKSLWAVDVGNYTLSRASSYAATALAAREIGDHEVTDLLLNYLDQDHPYQTQNEISYRKNASLWANANAFTAKISKKGSLQKLICNSPEKLKSKPELVSAPYPDYLVAKAKNINDTLQIVLYPCSKEPMQTLSLKNLHPETIYKTIGVSSFTFTSDQIGEAKIQIPITERVSLHIRRA